MRHEDSLLLNIISKRNFVYISIFKNGPKYAPMVVRFIFSFQVFKSVATKL